MFFKLYSWARRFGVTCDGGVWCAVSRVAGCPCSVVGKARLPGLLQGTTVLAGTDC